MYNKDNDNSQELLRGLLKELATEYLKPEDSNSFYLKLEKIYFSGKKVFRHYYSDIFDTISQIKVEMDEAGNKKDLGKLRENIKLLHDQYDAKKTKKDLTECIKKLYDHISLEVARLEYNDRVFKVNIENSITESVKARIDESVENVKEDYKSLKIDIDKISNDLKRSEKNYITILGIFASLVVTFVSGLLFSSEVLSNISSVSVYRLIVVILLLGFVLITICFSLYWFITRIINNDNDKELINIYLTTIKVIVILLLICGLLWGFGIVEGRNKSITPDNNLIRFIISKIEECNAISTISELK